MKWLKRNKDNSINIGDLFCIEMEDKHKVYFQYLGEKTSDEGGELIRVFKTRYPINIIPDVCQLVQDEIMFYAYTRIIEGIKSTKWSMIGHSDTFGLDIMSDSFFAIALDSITIGSENPVEVRNVEKLKYWKVWRPGAEASVMDQSHLPLNDKICLGYTFSPPCIVDRAAFGYYKIDATEFGVLKRIPFPEVNSFVRQTDLDLIYYFHFRGDKIVREIISGNGKGICLSREFSEESVFKLSGMRFWEINWEERDFISEGEFEEVWHRFNKNYI